METLFARDLGRARAHGRLHGALAGSAGIWDIVRRAAYERVRQGLDGAVENHDFGSPSMPQLTTQQLLRRHAASFTIAFGTLTVTLLALFAARQLTALLTSGASSGTIAEALLLATPFTAALTIPMAVLVAVLWEFTRLAADGTLAIARREHAGIRRLVIPVLGAAAGVAALAFVVTAEIVPRANERLVTVLAGQRAAASDRMMTIGELRDAARTVRPGTEPLALARAARYEVEFQKKLALPAACAALVAVWRPRARLA